MFIFRTTIAMAILAGSALSPMSRSEAEEVKLVVPSLASNIAQIAAAIDKGYFKKEGFDVKLTVAAGNAAIAALISGDVPYCASPSSSVNAIIKGAPLKVVLISHDRAPYTLRSLVPNIRTLADLKGQPVNITTRGGTQEISILMFLDKHDLPHNYVGFTPMGFGHARIAGLISGTQPVAVLSRSDAGQLRDAGKLAQGHLIADLNKEVILPTGGLVVTTKRLATEREQIHKFLRAVWKGTIFVRSPAHKEESIDILHRMIPKASRETIAADFEGALEDMDANGQTEPAEAKKELAIRAEMLKIPPEKLPPLDGIYDFSLIRQVISELKESGWKPAS